MRHEKFLFTWILILNVRIYNKISKIYRSRGYSLFISPCNFLTKATPTCLAHDLLSPHSCEVWTALPPAGMQPFSDSSDYEKVSPYAESKNLQPGYIYILDQFLSVVTHVITLLNIILSNVWKQLLLRDLFCIQIKCSQFLSYFLY